jgi:hypothetical protein
MGLYCHAPGQTDNPESYQYSTDNTAGRKHPITPCPDKSDNRAQGQGEYRTHEQYR